MSGTLHVPIVPRSRDIFGTYLTLTSYLPRPDYHDLRGFSTRQERFELPTFGSVDRRSIQLSYWRSSPSLGAISQSRRAGAIRTLERTTMCALHGVVVVFVVEDTKILGCGYRRDQPVDGLTVRGLAVSAVAHFSSVSGHVHSSYRTTTVLGPKTERAGFEPAMECNPHTRLAGECLQPLGHLSWRFGQCRA